MWRFLEMWDTQGLNNNLGSEAGQRQQRGRLADWPPEKSDRAWENVITQRCNLPKTTALDLGISLRLEGSPKTAIFDKKGKYKKPNMHSTGTSFPM